MTEVIECLKSTFNKCRSEATYQSIDETMVKCKARTTMKQRIPQKPEKNGIKNWTRADAMSGYVYDFNVYEGAEVEAKEGTLGERVCIGLRLVLLYHTCHRSALLPMTAYVIAFSYSK